MEIKVCCESCEKELTAKIVDYRIFVELCEDCYVPYDNFDSGYEKGYKDAEDDYNIKK